MVWTPHANAAAPVPYWTIPPERFIGLHPRLTDLTPGMIQILGRGKKVTTRRIMDTTNDEIKTRWDQRGISQELAGNQSKEPPGQPRTELEQPGTPQQNNFTNTKETRLAFGIYTVLSSLYAVRNWKIDFVQQTHIGQARNWMAAIGHAIHEVVSLHQCRCGQSYEQWGNRPIPPYPTCEKIRLRNTGPGKRKGRTMKEQTEQLRPASSLPPKPRPPDTDQTQDMTPFSRWQKRNRAHPENPENPSETPKGALPI